MGGATPILDQSHHPGAGDSFIVEDTQWVAQSFTVGISGTLAGFTTLLSRINFPLPTLGIDWELREMDATGLPKGNLLANGTLAPNKIFENARYIPVDLTSFAIPVSVGETYAIVLKTLEPPTPPGGGLNPYGWAFGEDFLGRGGYSGGTFFITRPTVDWTAAPPDSRIDLGFETFVDCPECPTPEPTPTPPPPPIPEPTTVLLLGTGLGVEGVRRRMRHQQNAMNKGGAGVQ
jgi:hypothetical protein